MKNNIKSILVVMIPVLCVFAIIQGLISTKTLNTYYTQILILIGINIILAVSLNLIIGYTGQLALGHAGFMSIGGYAAAMLTLKFNLPFAIVLLGGGLTAALFGILIGVPALRLKGDYLAITTLGFGEIIRVLIVNIDALGGARGLAGIPKKTNFAIVFFIVFAMIVIVRNMIKSSHGRAMISVREDEIAAEAMGINTTKYKVMAFVMASFFAGIAGGLYGHYFMFLDPKSFDFLKSFDILAFVVFGGMGSLSGCVLSTAILTTLPEALRPIAQYRLVIYALCLVLLMLFRPQGLLGTKELSLNWFKNLIKRKNIVELPKEGGREDVVA